MDPFSDELRFALIFLLNGGLFVAAYRFVRRHCHAGIVQAICDAFLIYFLIQYAAVAIPGVLGIFSIWTMSVVALAAAGAMEASSYLQSRHSARPQFHSPLPTPYSPPLPWTPDHFALLACFLFTGGFLTCHAFNQRFVPPVATDGLVYHLPTAVQWIQTGRLGIYPTWYWNPAASYSPETGSIFMAWLMAPAGNDVFVRYVQLPPLLFIFFLTVRISRLLGATRTTAGLIGVAATLSRPLFSEAVFAKDDLFVTAFVAAAVVSLAGDGNSLRARPSSAASERAERARTPAPPLSAWRVGVAFGLVLACKYTVMLACPVFLFMIDAPFRARWRIKQWLIAVGIVIVMAFPWYLRNILLTGNPLYPVDAHLPGLHLQGLFSTERDQQLRSAGGVWRMLAETYHSLPLPVIGLLLIGWAWTVGTSGKAILREPLRRACVIGSPITIAVFLITSPHHEVRYLFPLIVLLFASVGGNRGRLPLPVLRERVGVRALRNARQALTPTVSRLTWLVPAIAGLLAAASVLTVMDQSLLLPILYFAGISIAIAAIGVTLIYFQTRVWRLSATRLAIIAASFAAFFAMGVFVFWHAYVEQYRVSYRMQVWASPNAYPLQGALWKWVDEQTPPDASLAYVNTFFVYPYYGFNFTRRVAYAPVRHGLHDFLHYPRLGGKVPGDLIVKRMTEVMDADPDRETWLTNLRSIKADYLIVMKGNPAVADLDSDPPELRFARQEPGRFHVTYEDDAGVVFRIN